MLLRFLGASVVAAVAWVVVTALLFVWPRSSYPTRADAVIVPSGDHGERLAAALRLIREGVTRVLVLDGSPDFAEVFRLCGEPQPFEVICLRPDPDNTRGEARAAGQLAAQRGWKSVVLVTTTHHLTRAGLLFSRCIDGKVHTVGAAPPYGWRMSLRQIPREWLGLAHAGVLARSC
ncbi:MAG TPA: YdcF family protein [Acidimicrobiales bacterium]|nr:YdcF family protein [Acidimicrobiales bacterium]